MHEYKINHCWSCSACASCWILGWHSWCNPSRGIIRPSAADILLCSSDPRSRPVLRRRRRLHLGVFVLLAPQEGHVVRAENNLCRARKAQAHEHDYPWSVPFLFSPGRRGGRDTHASTPNRTRQNRSRVSYTERAAAAIEVVKTRRWNGDRPMQPVAMRGRAITPAEALAEFKAKCAMRAAEDDSEGEEEEEEDYYAFQASRFKDTWDFAFYGSFDEITKIPPMRFTDKKPEPHHSAFPRTTLQIFSLKVTGTRGGLQWPLHVFGKVAVRDSVDRKRNMIFDCTRDKCQFLTPEVPYLKLTGPTRAVVLLDPVTFDVDLKVKGTTESDDKHLSFLAVPFMSSTPLKSMPLERDYTSKLSTLKFALGVVVYSVEASITVQVTRGSWPSGFRAQFVAHTSSIIGPEVILLDSGDDKVPLAGDGTITLSRSVASVEVSGKLKVSVKAWQGANIVEHSTRRFRAKKAGRSVGTLDLSFCNCNMGVTVAWSLVSSN